MRRMSLLWPTETDVSESLMTLPNLSNVRTPKMLIGLEGANVFMLKHLRRCCAPSENFRAALGATT